ncbi:Domain of uncharacterised function DUF [Morganella morganii]|nr:Domain of uncharacterised function DUF [Morganella morganii]
MSFYATLVLALALSMDAFAVAVCKGATLHKPPLREALRTGFIFGVIEALTPLIGWAIGIYASRYVMEWDHWIAFSLLFILGARMIYNSVTVGDDCCARHEKPQRHSALHLATTAVATSLDADGDWCRPCVSGSQYCPYRDDYRADDHDYGHHRDDPRALYRPDAGASGQKLSAGLY